MKQATLLKILLSLSLIIIVWMYFNPRQVVVYERDRRVLEENKRKEVQILQLQHERDSLRLARIPLKERIVYRYIKLKEDEKIINDADISQLDSIIRTGF